MKKFRHLPSFLVVASLLSLPACDQKPNANKTDGIKDALDVRPNEELRDLGEDIGKAATDVGRDVKDAVKVK
jgi:predicted small secreted protein